MKLCLTNLSHLDLNINDFLNLILSIGCKNIELSPTLLLNKSNIEKKNISYFKHKNNVQFEVFQSIFYNIKISNSDRISINYLYEHFKKIIDLAKYFSVKKIAIGNMPSRKLNTNYQNLYSINELLINKFLDLAQPAKITLLIEPISDFYGNNFLINHFEVIEFINKINSPNLKLLIDTGNLDYFKNDINTFLKKNLNQCKHIHISNININEFNYYKTKEIIKCLYAYNFADTCSIEYFAKRTNKLNLKKLKNIYNNL